MHHKPAEQKAIQPDTLILLKPLSQQHSELEEYKEGNRNK